MSAHNFQFSVSGPYFYPGGTIEATIADAPENSKFTLHLFCALTRERKYGVVYSTDEFGSATVQFPAFSDTYIMPNFDYWVVASFGRQAKLVICRAINPPQISLPNTARWGERITIDVAGLAPNQPTSISAGMGNRWFSFVGEFIADEHGRGSFEVTLPLKPDDAPEEISLNTTRTQPLRQ